MKEKEKKNKKMRKENKEENKGISRAEDWLALVSSEDHGKLLKARDVFFAAGTGWLIVQAEGSTQAGIEKDKFRIKIVQPKIPMKAASSSYIWRRKKKKKRNA